MLRLPLKVEIFLMTKGADLICTVLFAGKDTFQLRNVKKRVYFEDNKYSDILITRKLIIDRESVIGYSTLEELITSDKPKLLKATNNLVKLDSFKK